MSPPTHLTCHLKLTKAPQHGSPTHLRPLDLTKAPQQAAHVPPRHSAMRRLLLPLLLCTAQRAAAVCGPGRPGCRLCRLGAPRLPLLALAGPLSGQPAV